MILKPRGVRNRRYAHGGAGRPARSPGRATQVPDQEDRIEPTSGAAVPDQLTFREHRHLEGERVPTAPGRAVRP